MPSAWPSDFCSSAKPVSAESQPARRRWRRASSAWPTTTTNTCGINSPGHSARRSFPARRRPWPGCSDKQVPIIGNWWHCSTPQPNSTRNSSTNSKETRRLQSQFSATSSFGILRRCAPVAWPSFPSSQKSRRICRRFSSRPARSIRIGPRSSSSSGRPWPSEATRSSDA